MDREIIPQMNIDEAFAFVKEAMGRRLVEKGYGTFASSHEVLGVLTEEHHELIEAVQSNEPKAFEDELVDVAVGAIFALACLRSFTMDW